MRLPFALILLGLVPLAQAQSDIVNLAQSYAGNAYALDDQRLLYREVHYLNSTGVDTRVVAYECPDGRVFARKRVYAGGDAQAPDFELEDARLGYREGVRNDGKGRYIFLRRSRDQPETTQPLPPGKDSAIDAGFDVFVQRHWQALQQGGTVSVPFLVPSRMRFFEFKVRRITEPSAGKGEMTIRLAIDSWFSFAVPHIDVTYDIATRRLLRFEGMSNIRGSDGKNLAVRIEFPLDQRHGTVDPAEYARIRDGALVSSCGTP